MRLMLGFLVGLLATLANCTTSPTPAAPSGAPGAPGPSRELPAGSGRPLPTPTIEIPPPIY